jgi:hypothetical protein
MLFPADEGTEQAQPFQAQRFQTIAVLIEQAENLLLGVYCGLHDVSINQEKSQDRNSLDLLAAK